MSPEPLRNLDVLIVENHADTQLYLRRCIELRGHAVRAAASVAEAREALAAAAPHVLISDIGLPDGDGWELLAGIDREQRPFAIAMSGYGSSHDRERSRAAGFRHHLTKPFDVADLDALLTEAAAQIGVAA